ncbi:MAG: helix-turn-helix domain-containing protein [Lachnospiraceae bacterium]|nr:helix-turn-helix domain-containing protein [Lachnospiraceae bacterium]
MKDYSDSVENCPIAEVQKIVHGKWTMVIIYFLSSETLRFSELRRKLPNVTEANLTKELRLLEQYGLVHREVYREVPPRVEYSLTPIGRKFTPVLEALERWAIDYSKRTPSQG